MMNLYPANKLEIKEVRKFIVIFYVVGIAGFTIPFLQPVFKVITPLALLLGVYLLAIYHGKFSAKSLIIFFTVFLTGLLVEMIGVNTGKIFGAYTYGKTLGPMVWNTPLMIGVNWLFLVYAIASITEKLKAPAIVQILVSSLMMIVYDLVMEQVAPRMDMWSWENGNIPLRNYFAWFVISFFLFSLLKIFRIKVENPLARVLLLCQFFFFLFLLILL
ncbi:MAG: carotenoid biosynthesis protein [Marinilabiliales bacterium]|nr:MAG: carotenoid biosynthesis protein [Marinilabiliales bacterium]